MAAGNARVETGRPDASRDAAHPLAAPLESSRIQPGSHPDSWCPTGGDFDAYLEAVGLLPSRVDSRGRQAQAPPPVVSFHDGVLVVEDSGRILRNDRVFDLPMETIEFVPSGDGYEVSFIPSAFEPVNGQAVFINETEWAVAQIALGAFAFPFGGEERTTFWMTTTNLISFEPPTEPEPEPAPELDRQGDYYPGQGP